jgi:hypothetical protein
MQRFVTRAVVVTIAAMFCLSTPGRAQPSIRLDQLAVPEAQLPSGCALAPAPSAQTGDGRVRGGLWAGLPIPTNPWQGADRRAIVAIRERMAGPMETPDGPPPSRRELAAARMHLADDVEEAHAAIYRTATEPTPVVVAAVRLNHEPTGDAAPLRRRDPAAWRAVSGRTAVSVSGAHVLRRSRGPHPIAIRTLSPAVRPSS